ncbi:MAG TPA: ATPase, T2SS/T4P/T4SS family [Microbacteriaceae bacterium]|nr:ATPase, T2SS/T4P/T4SS family [Microbacteriaceae bacterium]
MPTFNSHGEPASPQLTTPSPFGCLQHLVDSPSVTDVLVNRSTVWVDDGSGLRRVPVWFDEAPLDFAQRLIGAAGRHVDEVTPLAGASIDGVRVQVALPPAAPGGPLIAIRTRAAELLTLRDLEASGTLTDWQATLLRRVTHSRESVLISGGTGSGKTTLLRAMIAELGPDVRILTIEDEIELEIPHPHIVHLQSRQANVQGAGALGLVELLTAALRLRPDWLAVGECRGPELVPFLSALNTGHVGGGTVHANSLADVPARLEMLGHLAGLTPGALRRQVTSAFQWCVHLERTPMGRRARIARLERVGSILRLREVSADESGLVE